MTARVRVDAQLLTLADYAELEEMFDGQPIEKIMEGRDRWRCFAAMAWMLRRRDDPAYTLDDALQLRMMDLEIVGAEGNAPSVPHGAPQLASLAPGNWIP